MPIYTCTTTESTPNAQQKSALAREITRTHSPINHVPTTYINVVFHELPADSVYTGGVPASPVLVTSLFRAGHPEAETTRLVTEIAAVTRVTGIAADRVLVAMQTTPAQFALCSVGSSLTRSKNTPRTQRT
ncbi:MAG TPA: tautomerase family protein, partial [Mycobacterium sp.]|nr:tautomerase family protein [Mycobacterium sp.]